MKHKATNDFSEIEKEMMDTAAVNYILAQSDGFQLGYAQALSDFTENIIDYWKSTDDAPQQSILDILVDLGVELGNRQRVAKENIKQAKERGFEQYYNWLYREKDEPSRRVVKLYTRAEPYKAESEDEVKKDGCKL